MAAGRKSCLRAFFSIDIVGSTDFKARHSNPLEYATHWVRVFEEFFKEFPTAFIKHIKSEDHQARYPTPPKPLLWKILGDEILFHWEVRSFDSLLLACRGFYEAIRTYDASWHGKHKLRLKGTAWLAEFPIRNHELTIESAPDRNDFIGPDMDAGFRLAEHARAGRLLVSMDLADVLAAQPTERNFVFHHVGWARMRGVHSSRPYPLIWVRKDDHPPLGTYPWDGHECPYTAAFLQRSSEIDPRGILKLAKDIRQSLPDQHLVRPYCDERDMPDEHRLIWTRWTQDEAKEDDYGTAGMDLDEPDA